MFDLDFTAVVGVSGENSQTPTDQTYGFQFRPVAHRSSSAVGDILEVYLYAEPLPSCEAYLLLADYNLTVQDGNRAAVAGLSVQFEPISKGYENRPVDERWTLRVEWSLAEQAGCFKTSEKGSISCFIKCQVKIRELLTAREENYAEESLPRRDFALLVGQQKQFFVDLQYLADLGSEYFRDLLESKRKGVRRAVLMTVEAGEMELFLDAICSHRKPIITNRNFDLVLRLAHEFSIDKVLRACEAYLIASEAIHPIRKLEYAAEYNLGILGETIVRQLTEERPMAALCALHDYLLRNDETLSYMHPDVLQAINVFDDYVII